MEINNFDEVFGVVTVNSVVEGRFGLLTTHTESYDFGSREDLPGFKVPATADEAEAARFVITWSVDNRMPPYFTPQPAFTYTSRGGWADSANVPFTAEVAYTYPGYQNSKTIPSGVPALAFGRGVYTIPSGQYIDNANIKKAGAYVIVANTAEDGADAGKPKVQATFDDRVVGVVHEYDSSTGDLTIRLR